MSKLIIKDLAASKYLDKAAAMKIRGGSLINTNSLFAARPGEQRLSAAKLPSSIYNIVTNNLTS